jgi:hypothetical protein
LDRVSREIQDTFIHVYIFWNTVAGVAGWVVQEQSRSPRGVGVKPGDMQKERRTHVLPPQTRFTRQYELLVFLFVRVRVSVLYVRFV